MTARAQLLLALQHADSQFPSGGFAFSQGLEASSQLEGRLGKFDLAYFVHGQIAHRWAEADRVAVMRAHRCKDDLTAVADLDAEVEASTFSDLLRIGSRRNGIGLLTSHARLGIRGAERYRMMVKSRSAHGHLPVVQGLLWHSLGLDEETAVLMSGYQAAASLTTAAVRLGLVGAIEAQAVLGRTLTVIDDFAGRPIENDEPIRSFVPLAEIAVATHGASGQRLFSN